MKSLKKNGVKKTTKNNSFTPLKETFGKDYQLLGRCLEQLYSVLDTNEPYPLACQNVMHIYRHDELSLHGSLRRVYYTFVDNTGSESQSVESLEELVRASCKLILDYIKESGNGRCEPGDNIDCEGWNIEMISAAFNARLYAIKFRIYLLDLTCPQNEIEYELSPEQVNSILADITKKS